MISYPLCHEDEKVYEVIGLVPCVLRHSHRNIATTSADPPVNFYLLMIESSFACYFVPAIYNLLEQTCQS